MSDHDGGQTNHPFATSVRRVLHDTFITGLAVVIPLVVTLMVLMFIFNWVYQYIDVFSDQLTKLPVVSTTSGVFNLNPQTLLELMIPVGFVVVVFVVGVLVRGSSYGARGVDYFDYVIELVPGVGSVYESFRRMSDVMLESDSESFQEVKLVEFPSEGAYTLGFVTTETPEELAGPAGHDEMLTMFLPLAPNPIMGGHLVHMPVEKVIDVDMSVEEGIQAIVTSGVAIGEAGHDAGADGVSAERLNQLTRGDVAERQLPSDGNGGSVDTDADAGEER